MKLIDIRTADGSRHFVGLPKRVPWQALRDHLSELHGSQVVHFVTGGPSEAWLDFSYRGHRFAVRNGGAEYHFFVSDPLCSDMDLYQVACHFQGLLEP